MSTRQQPGEAARTLHQGYLYITCALLVACTVPWRRGTYFSGALDPVVAGKAVLGGLAVLMAVYVARRAPAQIHVGVRTIVLAGLYLAVTCLGGWAAGSALPSAVVAVRVAMLLSSLLLLLTAFGIRPVVHALIQIMAAVGLVSVATGAASFGQERLQGGLPPLPPNEIAFLCGAAVLLTAQRLIEGESRRWEWAGALGLFGIVWLTGSRTGAAALVAAVMVMIVQARRLTVPAFLSMVVAVPVVALAVVSTSAVTDMLFRGGGENVATLSSRTIAWQAALGIDTTEWQRWFGGGLTLKHIPVSGQYWREQLLDSSWISALVQGGLLGLALVAVWVGTTVVAAIRTPRPWRPLWTGILAFLVGRSFLESGLFDATTPFMLFAVVSAMSERAARRVERGAWRSSRERDMTTPLSAQRRAPAVRELRR